MKYHMHLQEELFEEIKNGRKKVEGRSSHYKNDRFSKIKSHDTIVFTNEETGKELITEVIFVHYYSNVKDMLINEGLKNIFPNDKTITDGIENYRKLVNYEERVKKFGIYAIGIATI